MNTAQRCRLAKEKSPQDWCPAPTCLWHTARSGPCQKHQRHIELCGETHPKYDNLKCVLAKGHDGEHQSRYLNRWPQGETSAVYITEEVTQ